MSTKPFKTKARVIGYVNGRPVREIRGADNLGSLLEESRDLQTRLASPAEGDDLAALVTRAQEVATAITQEQETRAAAEAARAALAAATPAPRPAAPAAAGFQPQTPADGRDGDPAPESRSIGAIFVQEVVQEARQRAYSGSHMVEIPGEVRALLDTTGWPVQATRVPDLIRPNKDRPLWVQDVVDRRGTTTNAIEYVEETTYTNSAAETTEGSAKPESSFVMTLKTAAAATIAHYVNISRQAADDDAQVQGYIEGRLVYGLQRRLHDQILGGNGTAPNLRGILNVAGIGTYTAGTATEAAVISIRKAITVAQLSEYAPDSVAINPTDWEAVELSTDSQAMFRVSPSVQSALGPRIWGLNVIVTTAMTATVFGTTGGTFLVGAFREGATLWERQGISLFLTDSHASNFTSNILTLLAEMRAALTVWRPKAFVKGTFGASRT